MEVFKITKYKATLRLLEEPFNIIKWFTNNFDKEIGALGIGDLKDGEMVIEKLVFPKQIVNGAHVHFKPEDWAPVIQELTEEEIGRIIFYWHKHPGSAGASQGDEDDTFDVFMPEEDCERKFFGFMQTAKKANGDMDYEARIELRDPIWASITDVELTTDQDDGIEETCEQIIKDKITVGYASARDQPGVTKDFTSVTTKNETFVIDSNNTHNSKIPELTYDVVFGVSRNNGNVVLEVNDYFESWIKDELANSILTPMVKKFRTSDKDGKVIFTITPNKKQGERLMEHFEDVYLDLIADDRGNTQSLESQIHTSEVYTEEKDIQEFNARANLMHTGWNERLGYWRG